MTEYRELYDTYEFPEPADPEDVQATVVDTVDRIDGYRVARCLGYGRTDWDSRVLRVAIEEEASGMETRERLFRWPYEFAVDIPFDTDEADEFAVRYRDNQTIWYDDVDEDAIEELVAAVRDRNFFTDGGSSDDG